jgi:hypothetical protein
VSNSLFEFFNVFGRLHSHEFHGVLLNELNAFIKCSENWVLLPLFEFKNLSFPDFTDTVNFCFDLSFFGSTFNKLCNLLRESVELKLDEIIKAEVFRFEFNSLLGETHQLFPMSIHHEFGVEFSNQRKNSIHVLDSFS